MFLNSIKDRILPLILIALANLLVLTLMLVLWTDGLELMINGFVRPFEFFKIIGVSAASLVSTYILMKYLDGNILLNPAKIKYAIILTLVLSCYLYVDYSYLILKNNIIDRNLRISLFSKIQSSKTLAQGTNGKSLTFNEYNFIARSLDFPELPPQSNNINYEYAFDGFLPDFHIDIVYDLPKNIQIDSFNISDGEYSKSLNYEIIDHIKRVSYSEVLK